MTGQPDRHRLSETLRATIARNLAGFTALPVADPALRPASVCVVVAGEAEGGPAAVLLTLRPERLNRHSGQYALPGGRIDVGETAREAALRELREEVRLDLGVGAVLGVLDDFPTRSGFRITPFVLWAGAVAAIDPDPAEVAEVFRIPLDELCLPEVPHLDWSGGGPSPVLSAPLPTLGHHVYAPTAAILYQFREVALLGRHTRVAHFEQPGFAWK